MSGCSRWLADSLTVNNIRRVCEILKAVDHYIVNKIVAHMPPVGCTCLTIHTIIHNVLQL